MKPSYTNGYMVGNKCKKVILEKICSFWAIFFYFLKFLSEVRKISIQNISGEIKSNPHNLNYQYLDGEVNKIKTDLINLSPILNQAIEVNDELETNINDGDLLNANLESNILMGEQLDSDLEDKTIIGLALNDDLESNITSGNTLNSDLESNITGANNINNTLNNATIPNANSKNTQLNNTISTANTTKTALDGSIATADTLKDDLDDLVVISDRVEVLEDEYLNASYTPEIYNTSSIFSTGKGTDASGNVLDYSASIEKGQVSATRILGVSRNNLAKSSNMDTDSNADGVVDDFVKSIGSGITVTYSLDSTEKAQKIEITESTTQNQVIVEQTIDGFTVNEVISSMGEIKISGNVEVMIGHVYYQQDGTYISAEYSGYISPTSFTSIKFDNKILPPNVGKVKLTFRVRPKETGNTGTLWVRKVLVEKTDTLENKNYITTGVKSTVNSLAIRLGTPRVVGFEIDKFETGFNANNLQITSAGIQYQTTGNYGYLHLKADYSEKIKKRLILGETYTLLISGDRIRATTNLGGSLIATSVSNNGELKLTTFVYTNPSSTINFENNTLGAGTSKLYDFAVIKGNVNSISEFNENYIYIKLPFDLKSLDNGTYDEVRLSENKAIQNVGALNLNGTESWTVSTELTNVTRFKLPLTNMKQDNSNNVSGTFSINNEQYNYVNEWAGDYEHFFISTDGSIYVYVTKTKYNGYSGATNADKFKAYLADVLGACTYQLQSEIVSDINVYGDLYAYKNGTIMINPYIRKELIYDNGITFSNKITTIDKIKKMTDGKLQEIDFTATIASDGLSATITELSDGDFIVVYAPVDTSESTIPTTSMRFASNTKAIISDLNSTSLKHSIQLSDHDSMLLGLALNYIDLDQRVVILETP